MRGLFFFSPATHSAIASLQHHNAIVGPGFSLIVFFFVRATLNPRLLGLACSTGSAASSPPPSRIDKQPPADELLRPLEIRRRCREELAHFNVLCSSSSRPVRSILRCPRFDLPEYCPFPQGAGAPRAGPFVMNTAAARPCALLIIRQPFRADLCWLASREADIDTAF